MFFRQSVSQSIRQSVNQSLSPSISLSVSHSVSLFVSQSVSQSNYPSVSQSISHSVHQPVSQSVCQSDSQTVNMTYFVDLKSLRPTSKSASHQQEPQVEGGCKRRDRRSCRREQGGLLKWTCKQRRRTQGNRCASKINRRPGVNCSAFYSVNMT